MIVAIGNKNVSWAIAPTGNMGKQLGESPTGTDSHITNCNADRNSQSGRLAPRRPLFFCCGFGPASYGSTAFQGRGTKEGGLLYGRRQAHYLERHHQARGGVPG
jgi:hypothetical protein